MNKTSITFHTMLEICNDEITLPNTKRKQSNNLVKLNGCHAIYERCKRKLDTRQHETASNEENMDAKLVEQVSSDSVENCRLKLKNGPIYLFERRLIDINNERVNGNNHSRYNSKDFSMLIMMAFLLASQFVYHYQ